MKCDEVQTMLEPYLDSELDARTALEIQQHLNACAECARNFSEEEKLEICMKAALNRGTKTAELWERIDKAVLATAQSHTVATPILGHHGRFDAFASDVLQALRACCGHSRFTWTALGAVWVLILFLNFSNRQPSATTLAVQQPPPATQMRFALKQQKLLLADLIFSSESGTVTPRESRHTLPSPRSERNQQNLNS